MLWVRKTQNGALSFFHTFFFRDSHNLMSILETKAVFYVTCISIQKSNKYTIKYLIDFYDLYQFFSSTSSPYIIFFSIKQFHATFHAVRLFVTIYLQNVRLTRRTKCGYFSINGNSYVIDQLIKNNVCEYMIAKQFIQLAFRKLNKS